MGKNLVVVAIPEEQDRVWKISSEKVPHLTLLFLGDADSNPHVEDIVLFVEHAVEICQHGPFYLDVDRRGTLGPDDADVVFFSKRSWNLKWIKQFRSQLLQNENIRTAYDSTDQYDEWQPHLTMGYPVTPAKTLPDPLDDTIYSVRFDKIAVWVDDYDGPEFQLEWPERDEYGDSVGALAYSDTGKSAVANILEHHGVKGMHWGIRKDRPAGATKSVTKRIGQKISSGAKAVGNFITEVADAHFEGKASDATVFMRVHDRAAATFNAEDIPRINNKAEYRDADFTRLGPRAKLTKQYEKEMLSTFDSRLRESVKEEGTNWSGTRKLAIDGAYHSEDGWGLKVVNVGKAKHAAIDDHIIIRLKRDDKGFITDIAGLALPTGAVAQSALVLEDLTDLGAEFVEHHGVLGMKWGIRKDRQARSVVAKPKNALSGKQQAAVIAFGGFAFLSKGVRDNYDKNVVSGTQYRQDKSWEKDFQKGKSFKFDDQKFTDEYNAKWKSHDFSNEDWNNPSPTYKKYQDGYFKEMNTEYTKQVAAHYGTSPSGKYEAVHVPGTDMVKLRKKDTAQHADIELDLFRVKRDSKGFIVGLEEATDSMAQTTELGKEFVAHQSVLDNPDLAAQIKAKLQSILDDVTGDPDKDINLFGDPIIRVKLQSVLQDFYKNPNVTEAMVYSALGELAMEHHGIKGMHWGIRRDHPSGGPQAVQPSATSRVPAGDRRKTKIKTEGGQNIDAHPDAIRVAESKAKLKKSGPSALSNQELRDVSSRVRLESEALLLTSHKGKQFVKRQLLGQGESVTRAGLREGTKGGLKKAGFAGAAAAL